MKNTQKLLSMILALVLVFSMQAGNLTALAEEAPTEALPLTETLPSPVLEDGHFDADLLTQWVDAYLDENYWNHPGCKMTIAYWYSGTDETWFYNADEWLGCVNWYKLPLCMYYAEKLKSGEMTKETVVTGITLEYAMSTLLEHSSGPSLYSLVTDLADREGLSYTDVAKQYADLPESYFTSEYYNNAYTARLMMEITKTLFEGGEDRFPFVLEHMKKSQPYDMFKRDWNIQSKWEVAQTHAADWGGEGDDLIHCTAIFYTPTPAILTIMTQNIWDLDVMGGVAGHFFNLTEELDLKQHPERAAELAAAEAAKAAETSADAQTTADGQTTADAQTTAETQSTETTGTAATTGDAAGSAQSATSMPAAGTEGSAAESAQAETEAGTAATTGETQQTRDTPEPVITPPAATAQPAAEAEPTPETQLIVQPSSETPPAGTQEAIPAGTTGVKRSSPIPILIVLFILLVLIAICSILLVIHNRKERERRRRRAAAIRRRRREREMQERYEEEENESNDEEE